METSIYGALSIFWDFFDISIQQPCRIDSMFMPFVHMRKLFETQQLLNGRIWTHDSLTLKSMLQPPPQCLLHLMCTLKSPEELFKPATAQTSLLETLIQLSKKRQDMGINIFFLTYIEKMHKTNVQLYESVVHFLFFFFFFCYVVV